MAGNDTETFGEKGLPWVHDLGGRGRGGPALVIAWSLSEPARVGERCVIPARGAATLGRAGGDVLGFERVRPGHSEPTGPLTAGGISRRQLDVRREDDGLLVENLDDVFDGQR